MIASSDGRWRSCVPSMCVHSPDLESQDASLLSSPFRVASRGGADVDDEARSLLVVLEKKVAELQALSTTLQDEKVRAGEGVLGCWGGVQARQAGCLRDSEGLSLTGTADCGVQVALEGKLRSREEEVKRVSQLLEDDYAEGKVRSRYTQKSTHRDHGVLKTRERLHSVDHGMSLITHGSVRLRACTK